MENVQEYKTGVARINTDTIINSATNLSETQKRALFYLISLIDHNKFLPNEIITVTIPFADMVKGLGTFGIKWKDGKIKYREFISELLTAKLEFLSEVEVNGEIFSDEYPWFSGIENKNLNGTHNITIGFNPRINNTIYNLKQFTRLYSNDFVGLKGRIVIDLFSLLVATFRKQSSFKDKVIAVFYINDLKKRLNVDVDEYKVTNDFKRKVLDRSIQQINLYTSIYVWVENIKENKKTIGFKFFIVRNFANSKDNFTPSNREVGQLKIYEYEAYRILKNYGVVPGIIVKQIIPNLPKGVLKGYEDLFIKACIQDFELNTNQKTAKGKTGAFVQWFCQNKVYSQDNDITFNRIREIVLAKFKTLSAEEHNERNSNTDLTVLAKYGEQSVLEF
ncbi:MAG: replication initiation protein [Flavobacteriales bacterium]|nr:replication initiation protein [Flavobacteriales bacterium]